MTEETRDRTKALVIERDHLRGEVKRLSVLVQQLEEQLDHELALGRSWETIDEVVEVLHSVKHALPAAEQIRVSALIVKLKREGVLDDEIPI